MRVTLRAVAKTEPPRGWGRLLADLRREAGLTGNEVARRLEHLGIVIDRASIYAYENGRISAPDAGVVWGLAHIYGVPVEDLIATLVRSRTNRAAASAPRLPMTPTLHVSDDERALIRTWRTLSPTAKRACQQFIDFQRATRMS